MKILFEFSRGGLEKHGHAFTLLREYVVSEGHTLTNDLLADSKPRTDLLPKDIYRTLQRAMADSQCVIIEGSVISLSVGFILGGALNMGKPVLFLVHNGGLSQRNRFVSAIESKLLTYKTYATDEELLLHLKTFLRHHDYIKTRFNLVLPNELNSYVTVESQKMGISKTEYIAGLIHAKREDT